MLNLTLTPHPNHPWCLLTVPSWLSHQSLFASLVHSGAMCSLSPNPRSPHSHVVVRINVGYITISAPATPQSPIRDRLMSASWHRHLFGTSMLNMRCAPVPQTLTTPTTPCFLSSAAILNPLTRVVVVLPGVGSATFDCEPSVNQFLF